MSIDSVARQKQQSINPCLELASFTEEHLTPPNESHSRCTMNTYLLDCSVKVQFGKLLYDNNALSYSTGLNITHRGCYGN